MIPYGHQDINDEDIDAVVEVLRSDRITQGQAVENFENCLCELTGAQFAVSTNSATSALHLACMALGVDAGSLVWTSANTYVASANCARLCGADVDFIDIDPKTGNLSVAALEQKLASANRIPDVVIPVHFAGQPCDMKAIGTLAQQYGFRVIEDASHALGAAHESVPVGACQYSDIAVFSFHPVKIATTGEGGALLCNDAELARKSVSLRSHGVTRDASLMTGIDSGSWVYEQLALGCNYRLTDIQAALGCSQLKRLDVFVSRRREIAARYAQAFDRAGIRYLAAGVQSSVHLFVIRVDAEYRKVIFDQLVEQGVGVNVHYIPVYWQPYYRQLGFVRGQCPESEHYYAEAISLPVYPALTDQQQDFVIEQVTRAVGSV